MSRDSYRGSCSDASASDSAASSHQVPHRWRRADGNWGNAAWVDSQAPEQPTPAVPMEDANEAELAELKALAERIRARKKREREERDMIDDLDADTPAADGPRAIPLAERKNLPAHEIRAIEATTEAVIAEMDEDEEVAAATIEGLSKDEGFAYICCCCKEHRRRGDTLPLTPHLYEWGDRMALICWECCQGHTEASQRLDNFDPRTAQDYSHHKDWEAERGCTIERRQAMADDDLEEFLFIRDPRGEKGSGKGEGAMGRADPERFRHRMMEIAPVYRPFVFSAKYDGDSTWKTTQFRLFNKDGSRRKLFTDNEAGLREFNKAARFGWVQYFAMRVGDFTKNVRSMTFEKYMKMVEKDHPGAKRTWLKKVLFQMPKWWVGAWMQSLNDCTPEQRLKATVAFARWEENRQLMAADPAFCAELKRGILGCGATEQYADLTKTISKYYICRNRDCRNFCPPTCWIRNKVGQGWEYGQFRCPRCYTMYRPVSDVAIEGKPPIPASFVYVLQGVAPTADNKFGKKGFEESLGAAAGQKAGHTFFLSAWPSVAEQILEQELQLIMTGIMDHVEDLSPQDIQAEISRLSRTGWQKSYLVETPAGPTALGHLDWSATWGFDGHGDRATWRDLQLPMGTYDYEEGRTVVMDYRTIMRLWALTKVANMGADLHGEQEERRSRRPPPPPPPPLP